MFIRYPDGMNVNMCYNPKNGQIFVSHDAIFFKEDFSLCGKIKYELRLDGLVEDLIGSPKSGVNTIGIVNEIERISDKSRSSINVD